MCLLHKGLCSIWVLAQTLCKLSAGFFVAVHNPMQLPAIDVQVAAGRGEVRVPQHLRHVVDGYARLIKPRPCLVSKIAELEPF